MTESTELLAFKRQKDGYKVTIKISLCIFCCSIVRRNQSPAKFTYLSPPFIGISRHESLQFVKKSNITHPYLVYLWFYKTNKLFRLLYYAWVLLFAGRPGFTLCNIYIFISEAGHAVIDINTNEYLPSMEIFFYVELTILKYVTYVVTNRCFSRSVAVQSGLLLQCYWNL